MNRKQLLDKLLPFKGQTKIGHAIEILMNSKTEIISNNDIGDIWERISGALDSTFSDDHSHPLWAIEVELSRAYKREVGRGN